METALAVIRELNAASDVRTGRAVVLEMLRDEGWLADADRQIDLVRALAGCCYFVALKLVDAEAFLAQLGIHEVPEIADPGARELAVSTLLEQLAFWAHLVNREDG
jgi:hypothetical protein